MVHQVGGCSKQRATPCTFLGYSSLGKNVGVRRGLLRR